MRLAIEARDRVLAQHGLQGRHDGIFDPADSSTPGSAAICGPFAEAVG